MVPALKLPSEVREGEIRLSTAHPPNHNWCCLFPFLGQWKRQVRIVVPALKIPSEVREGEIRLSTAHPPSGEAYSPLLLVQLSISSI
ncbi:MAG: hypothetical protein OXU61_01460 [Gammaproteobacteria bacterium]|nr:hypothetical protein [Gammaproteobacteria bacterium]